jgi:hypothetical protein
MSEFQLKYCIHVYIYNAYYTYKYYVRYTQYKQYKNKITK